MSVAEIVDAVDVGQSTVSHHLKLLADVCFVFVERAGTSSHWRINERCLQRFPTAAELVMGRVGTHAPWEPTRTSQATPPATTGRRRR